MAETVEEILNDFQNYLKYYKKNYNYIINTDELKTDTNYNFELAETSLADEVNDTNEVVYSETEIESGMAKKKIAKNVEQENWMRATTLLELKEEISGCKKCRLWKTRKNFVFGEGDPNANLVVVGEAPGADEDEQGMPFVGRAGKLLTEILKAINFSREEIFICNILKSRPPGNRNPEPDEIAACEPYLFKQLDLIKPKIILAVGTFAAQTLLRTKEPLGKLRGKFHEYNGIPMMVTFHPAALLRNPNWKRPTWEDVQLLRKEYDRLMNQK